MLATDSSIPASHTADLSASASKISLGQNTTPKTTNPNDSKRKLTPSNLGNLSRLNLQTRNKKGPDFDY